MSGEHPTVLLDKIFNEAFEAADKKCGSTHPICAETEGNLRVGIIAAIDASVAAERERCAEIARKHLDHKSHGSDCACQILHEIENAE